MSVLAAEDLGTNSKNQRKATKLLSDIAQMSPSAAMVLEIDETHRIAMVSVADSSPWSLGLKLV